MPVKPPKCSALDDFHGLVLQFLAILLELNFADTSINLDENKCMVTENPLNS